MVISVDELLIVKVIVPLSVAAPCVLSKEIELLLKPVEDKVNGLEEGALSVSKPQLPAVPQLQADPALTP
jgi:hypothetical protein